MKRLLALLLMALLGGLVAYGFIRNVPPELPAGPDFRMPTGKPLLEPDRPDLIGDPGIQPEDKDEGDTDGTRTVTSPTLSPPSENSVFVSGRLASRRSDSSARCVRSMPEGMVDLPT